MSRSGLRLFQTGLVITIRLERGLRLQSTRKGDWVPPSALGSPKVE